MATPLYSTLIASRSLPSSGAFVIGSPPSGYLWVAVDVSAMNGQTPPQNLGGIILQDVSFNPWMATPVGNSRAGVLYRWTGRQVFTSSDEIQGVTPDGSWRIRISGYVLSEP